MRRYKPRTASQNSIGIFDAFWVFVLIAIAALLPVVIFLGPQIIEKVQAIDLSKLFAQEEKNETLPPPIQISDPDTQKYYELKNLSCGALSKDFLIATEDVSQGSLLGLIAKLPEEISIAEKITEGYNIDQKTRTYVRGNMMKKVLITGGVEHTTIWKEGRIYQCNPNCTMHLLGDAGWQAYLDSLSKMRTDCAYFGRTKLPQSVNMSRLISIKRTGRLEMNGFRCENFLIFGNKTYAQSLLSPNLSFSDDQRSLIWAVANLAYPVNECLDDGIGVLVYRNITLDLTKSYRFEYSPGGFMHVNQQTNLTYYTDNVPESFLALPK